MKGKLFLGWLIDTRAFRVFLPPEKAILWTKQIDDILLSEKRIPSKTLESVIGRLNHVGFILPHARYFINRLRYLLSKSQKFGPQHINERVKNDLLLWKKLLSAASQIGTNINLITFTKWNIRLITDASESGIGGYNTETGMAWRIELPSWMKKKFHINFLEFLSATVAIWIEILQTTTKYNRLLCLTDSSSVLGWLYKSNFQPESHKEHDILARQLAEIMLESESALYSQHIKGKFNLVADSLSRDHHINNKQLTFLLNSLYSPQLKGPLRILGEIPREVTSFLESFRPTMCIKRKALQQQLVPSSLGTFFDGNDSWSEVVLKMNSLTTSVQTRDCSSCPRLLQVLETMKTAEQTKLDYMELQYEPPFPMYVRPSGRTYGGTRF